MNKEFLEKNFSISTLRIFAFLTCMDSDLYYEKLKLDFDVSIIKQNNVEVANMKFVTFEDMNKIISDEVNGSIEEETKKYRQHLIIKTVSTVFMPLIIFLMLFHELFKDNIIFYLVIAVYPIISFYLLYKTDFINKKARGFYNKSILKAKEKIVSHIKEILVENINR